MKVSAGLLDEIPTNRCVAVGDGTVIVTKVEGQVVAFQNRCLHQNSPLAGGIVLNGALICPMHFWRYRMPTGRHIGSDTQLPTYPVEVVDREVFVEVPDPEPRISMRDVLLRHAREWMPGA